MRGFFTFLESRQVRAAVLHGGEVGFERELSDVDFVVDHQTFPQLPALIDEYCTQAGWQLCQILRHETTAAYFVCSAIADPSCVVALDACSDYQRNGTLFLTADEMLAQRMTLPWGGHGLEPTMELRYRFAKAAAKGKNADASVNEFSLYPGEARDDCGKWLRTQWGVFTGEWKADDVRAALNQLRLRSRSRPDLWQKGAFSRIFARITHPTGLVVVTGETDFDTTAASLESVFGGIYFRHTLKARSFRFAHYKSLVSSTLIIVPELRPALEPFLPKDCVLHSDPQQSPENAHQALARHLQQRCMRRERLVPVD